jgi:aarF domain-containing kinase
MTWLVVLGAVAAVLALTLALPTTRRLWAFHLYAAKHFWRWVADALRLRGSRERLTRPVLLRELCEDLGPTFIKFGQIVASSAGMFPERYSIEFQRCLDRVRPFPFDQVQAIVAGELGPEKAARIASIEPTPLASASIAQVHGATLDDGSEVVIKVQRPGISGRVAADMRIMRSLARVAEKTVRDADLANPVGIVEDFSKTLREELDFRLEAKNLDRFNEIMAELGHRDVRAPRPVWDLTTERVLVMERFAGTRVDDVARIRARQIDAEEKLVKGLKAWFQSVIFYGFFHGDVHAGNLMLLDDDDIGFLDFGIVGRFDERQTTLVTDYIVAFTSGDFAALARVIAEMGGVNERVDLDAMAKDLAEAYGPLLKLSFGEINYADMLPEIQRVASRHRMRMPNEFVLITKQMLYFDRYAKLLAPNLNIFTDARLVASLMMDLMKARAQGQARAAAAATA